MDAAWLERVARRLGDGPASRRGMLRWGASGALAGLALGPEVAAALRQGYPARVQGRLCRRPKQGCTKGKQCCTGRCKQGKCARCAAGTALLGVPPRACWPWLAWGSEGDGDRQFRFPPDVAVGGGQVYVADGRSIQQFDAAGEYVRKWGSLGSGDEEFLLATGVAVGGGGQVYVADQVNHRVQEFDATGGFVRKWGANGGDGTSGGGDGHVYVADSGNFRVQEFTATGGFVRQWGGEGTGDGQFGQLAGLGIVAGVAVGSAGQIYVADQGNHRVQEFDATKSVGDPGFFVRAWGSHGTGDGQFDIPTGVAGVGDGRVYVADARHDRVQEFDAAGDFVRAWGREGSGGGQFDAPGGLAVDSSDRVYVADVNNSRIVRVQPR